MHQTNLAKRAKVYLIEKAETCARCPLRKDCTSSERGRSITLPLQAQLIAEGQQAAQSEAGRYSRKRRKHAMEGSFADAANNHGSKRAHWRGLARQKIQSWLSCAAQNLRILINRARRAPQASLASLEMIASASENAVQRWLAALSLQLPV